MKKYIFIIFLWLYLFFMAIPTYATAPITYTIDSQEQTGHLIIECNELDDQSYGECLENGRMISFSFDIQNLSPYNLQLAECQISVSSLTNLSFSLQNDKKQVSGFVLDTNSQKEIQEFFKQQTIASEQTLSFYLQYESLEENLESSIQPPFHFQLIFMPITVQGYIFQTQKDQDVMMSDIPVKLWQGRNLVDSTVTNEEGYYQLSYRLDDKQYFLEVSQCFDVEINSKDSKQIWEMKESSVYRCALTYQLITQQYDLQFTQKSYHLFYNANGGEGILVDNQNPYAIGESIFVLDQGGIIKKGSMFIGWCLQKNGTGVIYSPEQTFTMPSHDVTLYAIWKEEQKEKRSIDKKQTYASVQTSDETSITLCLLLLLVSIAGIVVIKSLKRK